MEQKKAKLQELIDQFTRNIKQYKSSQYDESNTRTDFIDKFFELLDWDVRNVEGYSEQYRDVVREDKVVIEGKPKAPDYSFRIGGQRKFFVEAKKPSVNIKEDQAPAFQLRRYAYTAKLPLSILTDFEEFAVYDTRIKPNKVDKASVGRIYYCTFDELFNTSKYDSNKTDFEYLYDIFAKPSILKGSFDKYIEDKKNKKGTSEVDKEFLKLIETWRTDLAKSIARNNHDLDVFHINQSVQKIIDRIIFLRIAEDKKSEEYGRLQKVAKEKDLYQRLNEIFIEANNKYNSGLFRIEEWLGTLSVDDKALVSVINGLYYPECPYEFSVLPVEILGHIYEQFLGKTIRLTPSHQAKVEEKPEVRKAGGVYYTPEYIVNYIVQNTVGEKVKRKKPADIEKLTILDPACGSGSFLVGAFSFLLKWHLDWYLKEKNKASALKNGDIYQVSDSDYRLTLKTKQKILINNIYGVDIDAQAVEVTKLSLLLKLMEDENVETGDRLFSSTDMGHILPDLSSNIKCGNSLIGSDFYADKQLDMYGTEDMRKINVFDWEVAFRDIFEENGGFDCVIGNPPYIRIQTLQEWSPDEVAFYKSRYKSGQKGNYDIYVLFIEKALSLLAYKGLIGYILPNKFLSTDYGEDIRNIISERQSLKYLVDFGHYQIFEQATTYTCLLFLTKSNSNKFYYAKIAPENISRNTMSISTYEHKDIASRPWIFYSQLEKKIHDKLKFNAVDLLDLPVNISRGSSSGNDKIFMLTPEKEKYKTIDGDIVDIENEILRKPIFATDYTRYFYNSTNNQNKNVIIFPYEVSNSESVLIKEEDLKKRYPLAYKYLKSKKRELEKRKQYKEWYGFSAPRNLTIHETADLLVPLLANKGLFSSTPCNLSSYCLMASGGFSISVGNSRYSPQFILGLINSKLLFWHLNNISNKFRGGWITCTKQYVGKLPIKKINFDESKQEKQQHDKMVSLVDQMLTAQKECQAASTDSDKNICQQRIDILDKQIDALVYELYGLTEEEIKIVEGS